MVLLQFILRAIRLKATSHLQQQHEQQTTSASSKNFRFRREMFLHFGANAFFY